MKASLFFLLLLLSFSAGAQLTPAVSGGTYGATVTVPAKYAAAFASGRILEIDTAYTVSLFHIGSLVKPRALAFSPAGVLHVADMNAGTIVALPDADNNGVADTILTVATGFSNNHDLKFYNGALYVTEPTRIWKCTDSDGDGVYETKNHFITGIGSNETTGHVTRSLVFDSVNHHAYVSVGSGCNVCREPTRAIIERYNDDGTGRAVFATGVRNAVGMAIHPATNRLWANNNGSDNQGSETPPEWIDIVRDGGFYGHPFAHSSGTWFNFSVSGYSSLLPITPADSASVAGMVPPAALIRAHSAPMALEFLHSGFGSKQHGFLTALRGSWNSPASYRGYKVVYAHLSSGSDTTVDYISDFCAGFITDTIARTYWGRPVGLATTADGKVYISSDETNKCILLMTPRALGSGVPAHSGSMPALPPFPNPTHGAFTLPLYLAQQGRVVVSVRDLSGKHLHTLVDGQMAKGSHKLKLDLEGLSQGNYIIAIDAGGAFVTHRIVIE